MVEKESTRRGLYAALLIVGALGLALLAYAVLAPRGGSEATLEAGQLSQIGDRVLGSADAPLVVVEFVDFQCGACAQYAQQEVSAIKSELVNEGLVRYVFADFPLSIHPHSVLAARAGRCAHEQGEFWAFHDRIFAEQAEWSGEQDPSALFVAYAGSTGVDAGAFEACLASDRYEEEVASSYEVGRSVGVRATPSLVINGRLSEDVPTAARLREMAVAERARAAASAEPGS